MMEKITLILKNQFDSVRFSARVFVVGIILSLTFFLLSIDSFKTYRSDVSILVSAKSQVALGQQDQLIRNIIEFPKLLSFYDRMLLLNPDVRDVTAGMAPDKRKSEWNKMISVARTSDNASVLKISIVTTHEADSKQLAVKSARTLFDTVAFYYDIKSDVDLRIIDGPISKSQVSFWYVYLIVSLFLGFAIAMLLDLISFSGILGLRKSGELLGKSFFPEFTKKSSHPVEQELESLSNLYQQEQVEGPFVFESKTEVRQNPAETSDFDEKFQEVKKITKEFEPSKYPNFPEMPIRLGQSENVPDNLPIADDTFFLQQNIQPEGEMPEEILPKPQEEQTKETANHEPTEEELKKRLNSLLRGEF